MNFEPSDDQRQFGDSVQRLLADHYSFASRRAVAASACGFSQLAWQRYAELGLTALPVPQAYGGLGGGARDLLPVLEAMGRALVLEPYLASTVLATRVLAVAGHEAQRRALLPRLADGSLILAWAHHEAQGRHLPWWIETTARCEQGLWRISGEKAPVLHGASASQLLVSARVAGRPREREGIGLFLVDASTVGATLRSYRLTDDSPAATLVLQDAVAQPLGNVGAPAAADAVDAATRSGLAALCAQGLGAMQGAYDLTIGYLQTREQFGRPLGHNQALRHRVAEMLVSLELVRSATLMASIAVDGADTADTADTDIALARAKLLVGRHGRRLCQYAVQLHGAIGMTEEYAVGHYLRKLVAIDQLFGDEHAQAAALAQRAVAGAAA